MQTTHSTKAQTRKPAPENFLEAFRELSRDAVSEAKTQITRIATNDIPQSFGLGSSGTLNPNESLSMDALRQAEMRGEQNAENKFDTRLSQMRQEERASLMRQESMVKDQIKSIQEEIRSLAKSAGGLAQEVQVATMQATVNPGAYQRNFFIHLKTLIITLHQRTESSRNWLATSNSRAGKKGGYWNQVKSSGTKFMLSSERYMVTSTG